MKKNRNIFLNQLGDNQMIEIFRLDEMQDTIFENYQRYDFYQIIWFTKVGGDASYYLDFKEYILKDNQVVIVYPGQIDMMDPQGKEGYLFAVCSESFYRINQRMNSDYLNGYLSNVFTCVDDATERILNQLMSLILQEYNAENRGILIESYLESFLFHVSALVENSFRQKSQVDSMVAELMVLIDKYFVSQRETDFYATQLGMTNKRINEICKKGTGKTIKQHLQERLVLEIKKEIRLQKKSLKEIAFDLGFNEAAYFTRFFKQHTSLTPTEFRDKRDDLSK